MLQCNIRKLKCTYIREKLFLNPRSCQAYIKHNLAEREDIYHDHNHERYQLSPVKKIKRSIQSP